jgi:benzoylformate decarboxylase
VLVVVVNNGHYGILKAFAAFQRTPGVPGLDLPGLDIPLIARGLGAETHRISSPVDLAESFQDAVRTAAARSGPVLLDVVVDPEVPALFGEPVS